jgi:hypothetical protein
LGSIGTGVNLKRSGRARRVAENRAAPSGVAAARCRDLALQPRWLIMNALERCGRAAQGRMASAVMLNSSGLARDAHVEYV